MKIISEQLINLPGLIIKKIEGFSTLIIHVCNKSKQKCIHCKASKLHIKDNKIRLVRHENFSLRATYLSLSARKFYCTSCGRSFWERFPGVLPYNRKTEPFRKQIAQSAIRGITRKDISLDYELGHATVHRYFLKELQIKDKELLDSACPKVLGIDEHFFTRKKGYATTLVDLRKNKVFDVVLGRSEASLNKYFRNLKGKENVQVVVIDLSENYRSIIKKHFPRAKIVSDRFHVIRLINHHFLALWKEIDPESKYNRGLTSLMRRHYKNLSAEQKIKLEKYFIRFPVMRPIYYFKQRLCKLLSKKALNQHQCRRLIPIFLDYIQQLKTSSLEQMVVLGKTLQSWQEEVVRMWRFTKSNGITEGFHNKMEMLSRRAYGFRNFNNYRLWVRILCR